MSSRDRSVQWWHPQSTTCTTTFMYRLTKTFWSLFCVQDPEHSKKKHKHEVIITAIDHQIYIAQHHHGSPFINTAPLPPSGTSTPTPTKYHTIEPPSRIFLYNLPSHALTAIATAGSNQTPLNSKTNISLLLHSLATKSKQQQQRKLNQPHPNSNPNSPVPTTALIPRNLLGRILQRLPPLPHLLNRHRARPGNKLPDARIPDRRLRASQRDIYVQG
jgi:hypothetical protein